MRSKGFVMNGSSMIGLAAAALFFAGLTELQGYAQMKGEGVVVKRVLDYEESGSKRTAVDEFVVPPNVRLPLQGHPQERLYYFLDGRGIMSIYEEAPAGDVYEVRQDIAIYMTPGIKHEIVNTGNSPLRCVVFLVKGGVLPEGELSWSAITQRGVQVDKPAAGSGVAVTEVFDEGSNPSQPEGLHLLIHDIWLRRPQIFSNAEVITIAPGRSTRLHTHHDSGETCYILYGEGKFVWDEKEIPYKAGSCISYPIGVSRKVMNTGQFPVSYVVISSFVK
jgi:mannose-6-phosphate isomerase-like protein (cupin superfamily)